MGWRIENDPVIGGAGDVEAEIALQALDEQVVLAGLENAADARVVKLRRLQHDLVL